MSVLLATGNSDLSNQDHQLSLELQYGAMMVLGLVEWFKDTIKGLDAFLPSASPFALFSGSCLMVTRWLLWL